MSCEIRNEKCPFQIHCSFPTAANDTRPFALYFYSSQGRQERVLVCGYNGYPTCFPKKRFEITHEGFNDVTITVPDTFATSKGLFGCQKGDIHMVKNCLYNPPEICNTISSTESGIGHGTTTKGIDPAVLAGGILGLIAVIALTIIIIVCLLLKKYRPKSCSRFKQRLICADPTPVIPIEEYNKPCLEKENTDNHVNQTTTDPASFSFNGGIVETKKVFNGDNLPTINEDMPTVDQEHTSTDNQSNCALSGLQPQPSPSVSRSSLSGSNSSNAPLLPTSTASRSHHKHSRKTCDRVGKNIKKYVRGGEGV
ncbi:uncharacterized protein LOC112567428 isoform X3 [Pomacea canaliculata]|uniref:uncharacterized protein LOC112567428 isoform X3 n=1 Tax=Pomacea canaliculata TaxID=400727 RepID=UPI000D72CA9B|nr:uncharacterized protein LOC112567428 isoform X3 [Pomacea canaliculata]